jgi:asparagine synthase (glutamine-hydrolysing)
MCGIAGFSGQGNRDMLERMGRAIERRGPDDAGFYEAEQVGFAFRRLSIIDIEGGHQPLSNEDQTVWVMLNGEIYNFVGLRDELQKSGHVFKTKSDTEVIAHGYEKWGDEVFMRLDGMFAIAIWDVKAQRLILARDRIGKKPVYWTQYKGTCFFASEIKALIAAGIPKKIRMQSVYDLFRTDSVPTPFSIIDGVEKLRPASALAWKRGKIEKQWSFWDCPRITHEKNVQEIDLVQGLRERIDAAVARRLVADVPLGLFLSGGIDSSVIADRDSQKTDT